MFTLETKKWNDKEYKPYFKQELTEEEYNELKAYFLKNTSVTGMYRYILSYDKKTIQCDTVVFDILQYIKDLKCG